MLRSLATDNRRILCASPQYFKEYGIPQQPEDLEHHPCLVMERLGEQLNQWKFQSEQRTVAVPLNLSRAVMASFALNSEPNAKSDPALLLLPGQYDTPPQTTTSFYLD